MILIRTRTLSLCTTLACAALAFSSFAAAALGQTPTPTPTPTTVPTPITTASPAALPPLPRLPEPTPQPTVPDLTRYLNNPDLLKFSTAQLAPFLDPANPHDADILFLGDSITQGWRTRGEAVWQANFASRNALDFGISGDQTQHVLWRMDNYPIQHLHPKVAIVLIGTNNLHNTAPDIAAGVKAVLTKTQTMYPGIKIILCSIMPNKRANDLMMAANTILRTFADGQTVYYLDLVPVMTPIGDNWTGLGPDHLHPDAAGYQFWADAILPLLNKLLPPPTTP